MYLETKEIARLYSLISDKLGRDTAEAMFKYIDNKTERAVKKAYQSLATKQDIMDVQKEAIENESKLMKWMLIFWIGQAMLMLAVLFLKK